MAITTRNRKDLKSNFVKNAIPTEQNFSDLVDAQLNQADDGVFKLAGEPFSVVAASGGQKRALRLYSDYPAANADWLISLAPAQNPADAATTRPGFGIADGAGNTRFFLDASGKLGLGTNEPAGAIDVRIAGSTNAWHRFVVGTSPAWGDANTSHVTIGAGGASGIMFSNPHVVWSSGRASIRYGRTGGKAGDTYWDVGVRDDGRFGFQAIDNGGAGEQVTISKAGQLTAKAGVVVAGAVGHIDNDGALYRNTDGQVYLTVDDNLFIRDSGAASWAAQFDTNSGSLNLKGKLNAATGVLASGNGGVLDIEGNDHAYIEFFPQKIAGGRKAWIGYGNANVTTLSVTSQGGDLALSGDQVTIAGNTLVTGKVAVNNASNTGVDRGLWLWNSGDSNHVIYSANNSGKTPANTTPAAGVLNNSHRMRFRTASGQGFLFENNADVALVDIASGDGDLWAKGRGTFEGGLTIPKGKPVAGVPVIVTRMITLKQNDHGWSSLRPSRWQWSWTETFDATVASAVVCVSNFFIEWGRNEARKTIDVTPLVDSVSGSTVRLKATFGWRDFSGDWDDALAANCQLAVVVIVTLNTAV